MRMFWPVLALIFTMTLHAEPWGKDADMARNGCCPPSDEQSRGGNPLRAVIYFHQNYISKADGPRSHFRPSSSEYMRQAVVKYGPWRGFILGCDRLMRENPEPWIYRRVLFDGQELKYDPVR